MTFPPAELVPPGFEGATLDAGPTLPAFMWIPIVLIVATVIFGIYSVVKNYRLARSRGYDPVTMETDMATRLMQSALLQPADPGPTGGAAAAAAAASLEDRLTDIDTLHDRGIISAEERAAARAKILGG